MPGSVQRLGDPNSGGGLIMSGDPSVLVNGRPIATFGASVTPHPPCNKVAVHCHASTQADQFTVLVNGKPVSSPQKLVSMPRPCAPNARPVSGLNGCLSKCREWSL